MIINFNETNFNSHIIKYWNNIRRNLLNYLDGEITIYYDTYYKEVIINYTNIINSDFNMRCVFSIKNNLSERETVDMILNSFKYELLSKIFK